MTPAEIASLQKRLRLNRAQFAHVLGVSAARLDDYKGKREKVPEPTLEARIILAALARYADVASP